MVPGIAQARVPRQEQVPPLRGILHAVTFPLAVTAGVLLVVLAPTPLARLAAAVYAVTSALLFGVSAAYHREHWPGGARDVLHPLDHADIYLIVAGTYTPLALLALHGDVRIAVLAVIWTGAAAGAAFRVAWLRAPRWLYTSLHVVLGWTAVFVLPQLLPLLQGQGCLAVGPRRAARHRQPSPCLARLPGPSYGGSSPRRRICPCPVRRRVPISTRHSLPISARRCSTRRCNKRPTSS